MHEIPGTDYYRCGTPSSIDSSASFLEFCCDSLCQGSLDHLQHQAPDSHTIHQSTRRFVYPRRSSHHGGGRARRSRSIFSTWIISSNDTPSSSTDPCSIYGLFRSHYDLIFLLASPSFDPEAWHFDAKGNLIYVPHESWKEAKKWLWQMTKKKRRITGRTNGNNVVCGSASGNGPAHRLR